MKKIIFITSIILLVIGTTITKNSTKKLDKRIFQSKENLRALNDKYEMVLLEYNYLTSPGKLMEYQHIYFDKELEELKINKIKKIIINDNKIIISDLNQNNE